MLKKQIIKETAKSSHLEMMVGHLYSSFFLEFKKIISINIYSPVNYTI